MNCDFFWFNPSYAGRDFSLVSRLVRIYQYPQHKIYCTHRRLKSRNDVTEQCSTVSTGYIFMLNMITCKLIFEHNIKHNRTSSPTLYASSRSKLSCSRRSKPRPQIRSRSKLGQGHRSKPRPWIRSRSKHRHAHRTKPRPRIRSRSKLGCSLDLQLRQTIRSRSRLGHRSKLWQTLRSLIPNSAAAVDICHSLDHWSWTLPRLRSAAAADNQI